MENKDGIIKVEYLTREALERAFALACRQLHKVVNATSEQVSLRAIKQEMMNKAVQQMEENQRSLPAGRRNRHELGLNERNVKTVTKEQCEAALGSISDAIEEYCLVVNKDVYSKLEAAQDVIHQLIEEHEKLKKLVLLWGKDINTWRDETSQLLQDAGFEDASKYLDAAWEL